jgi:hypothetical protein
LSRLLGNGHGRFLGGAAQQCAVPDETWFGIITRQSIRRGTFPSVKVLIKQIHHYIDHWNTAAKPFTWTATTDESWPRSASPKPTSRNWSTTTQSKHTGITKH